MQIADEIFEVFYGGAKSLISPLTLLTPIPAFYRAVVANARVEQSGSGWFKAARVTLGKHTFSIVQHPEGNRVVDAVMSLRGLARRTALLGLCGSVDPARNVGDTAFVRRAALPGGQRCWLPRRWSVRAPAGDASVLTVDGFLCESPSLLADAVSAGADVLDFETFHFFRAAAAAEVECAAWLVVSDRPHDRPFWTVQLSDLCLERTLMRLLPSILSAAVDPRALREAVTPESPHGSVRIIPKSTTRGRRSVPWR